MSKISKCTFSAFSKSLRIINILKAELQEKIVKLPHMKMDVGQVKVENVLTFLNHLYTYLTTKLVTGGGGGAC